MVRFGVCTSIKNIKLLENAGYDYIEPAVSSIAAMDEASFNETRRIVEASTIKCEAFNIFVPGSIKICGEAANMAESRKYLENAIKRTSLLGCRVIVLGSGGARRIPEGFPIVTAEKQFSEFLLAASDIASEYGIEIVIEPLREQECNYINLVSEGYAVAKKANHPNSKVLADLYHVYFQNEPMSDIIEAASLLRHTHIANPAGRKYPKLSDEYDYTAWFDAIKRAGYDGRMSVEGGTDDFEKDIVDSKTFLDHWLR